MQGPSVAAGPSPTLQRNPSTSSSSSSSSIASTDSVQAVPIRHPPFTPVHPHQQLQPLPQLLHPLRPLSSVPSLPPSSASAPSQQPQHPQQEQKSWPPPALDLPPEGLAPERPRQPSISSIRTITGALANSVQLRDSGPDPDRPPTPVQLPRASQKSRADLLVQPDGSHGRPVLGSRRSSPTSSLTRRAAAGGGSRSIDAALENRRSLADLDIREVVGEGSYSTVHRALDRIVQARIQASQSLGPDCESTPGSLATTPTAFNGLLRAQNQHRSNQALGAINWPAQYAVKILSKLQLIKENKVKYANIEKDTLTLLNARCPSTDDPPPLSPGQTAFSRPDGRPTASGGANGTLTVTKLPSSRRASIDSTRQALLSCKRRWDDGQDGIIKLWFTTHDETSLYFVLDLAVNGELLKWIVKFGSFDEECARFYSAQILSGIGFMHERGIIHRDLKPENILLDHNMHVKISDFGTAKVLNVSNGPEGVNLEDRANSFVGTAEYVSPELLKDKTARLASDLWAFGCIIFQLFTGRPPFKAANDYLTFQKILNLQYTFADEFPLNARSLVESLLVLDPEKRATTDEARNHPFFAEINFQEIFKVDAPSIKQGFAKPTQPPKPVDFSDLTWISDRARGDGEAGPSDSDSSEDEMDMANHHDTALTSDASSSAGSSFTQTNPLKSFTSLASSSGQSSSNLGRTPSMASRHSNRMKSIKGQRYEELLQDNESILFRTPIQIRSTGLIPRMRKRHLAITNFSRLLCVKDSVEGLRLKESIELRAQPGSETCTVEKRGEKGFLVMTPAKTFHFVADRSDVSGRWIQSVQQHISRVPTPQQPFGFS